MFTRVVTSEVKSNSNINSYPVWRGENARFNRNTSKL